jgi:hypothetical protein
MTEECKNCGKAITKYFILDIVEFVDYVYDDDNVNVDNEDLKVRTYST